MPDLLPGWEEAEDPKTKKKYFYNKSTKQTQWKRPEKEEDLAVKDAQKPIYHDSDATKNQWIKKTDPITKKDYYENPITGKRWTGPKFLGPPCPRGEQCIKVKEAEQPIKDKQAEIAQERGKVHPDPVKIRELEEELKELKDARLMEVSDTAKDNYRLGYICSSYEKTNGVRPGTCKQHYESHIERWHCAKCLEDICFQCEKGPPLDNKAAPNKGPNVVVIQAQAPQTYIRGPDGSIQAMPALANGGVPSTPFVNFHHAQLGNGMAYGGVQSNVNGGVAPMVPPVGFPMPGGGIPHADADVTRIYRMQESVRNMANSIPSKWEKIFQQLPHEVRSNVRRDPLYR